MIINEEALVRLRADIDREYREWGEIRSVPPPKFVADTPRKRWMLRRMDEWTKILKPFFTRAKGH